MYVDGHLSGKYGERHKISALETLQFSTTGVIADITKCVTMECKVADDLVYVLGTTHHELGGSEYYEHFGYTGLNVPQVDADQFSLLYKALFQAISRELVASAHGIYRGGLAVHLAFVAMGGGLGILADLGKLSVKESLQDDILLFSESAGRFIITIDPAYQSAFEALFTGLPCALIGKVKAKTDLVIQGQKGQIILSTPVKSLKQAWQRPFKDLL